jgi:hypothetical protein
VLLALPVLLDEGRLGCDSLPAVTIHVLPDATVAWRSAKQDCIDQACIHLTKQQFKHIDIKFHFTRHAEKTIKFRLAMGLS